jgi:uncharacterized protein (TIGR02246 family)
MLVLGLAVMVSSACSGGAQGPEFTRADGEAIRKQIQEFASAWNAKDTAKVVEYFTANGVVMPPNASTVRGHDSIRGYYDARFGGGGSDLVLEPKDVGGFGTIAYISGTFSSRTAPPDGKPATRDRGKFLWVMRKFNNQWKHEYQMWSSDLPQPVAAS